VTAGTGLRFKVDHNLPRECADLLRAAGGDADTAAEEGLAGAADGTIAEVCRRERRAVVTSDLGFADLRTYPPARFAGIVVLRLSLQSKPRALAAVRRVVQALEPEPLPGKLWIVDDDSIRIREGGPGPDA
jgi:predicted nuclease of predicted toxin-antitoxin system